jgi:hypothetical protein
MLAAAKFLGLFLLLFSSLAWANPQTCEVKKKCPLTLVDDVFSLYPETHRDLPEIKRSFLEILKARNKNLIPKELQNFDLLFKFHYDVQVTLFEDLTNWLGSSSNTEFHKVRDLLEVGYFALKNDMSKDSAAEQFDELIMQKFPQEKAERTLEELRSFVKKDIEKLVEDGKYKHTIEKFTQELLEKESFQTIGFANEVFGESIDASRENVQKIEFLANYAINQYKQQYPLLGTTMINEYEEAYSYSPKDLGEKLDKDNFEFFFDKDMKLIKPKKEKGKKKTKVRYDSKVKLSIVDGKIEAKVKIKSLREGKNGTSFLVVQDNFNVDSQHAKQRIARILIEDGNTESFHDRHIYGISGYDLVDKPKNAVKDVLAQRGANVAILQLNEEGKLRKTALFKKRPSYLGKKWWKYYWRAKFIKPTWHHFKMASIQSAFELTTIGVSALALGKEFSPALIAIAGSAPLLIGTNQNTYRNLVYVGTEAHQWFKMIMFPGVWFAYGFAAAAGADFSHWTTHATLVGTLLLNNWAKVTWKQFNYIRKLARLNTQEFKINGKTLSGLKQADVDEVVISQIPRMAKSLGYMFAGDGGSGMAKTALVLVSSRYMGQLFSYYGGKYSLSKAKGVIPYKAYETIESMGNKWLIRFTDKTIRTISKTKEIAVMAAKKDGKLVTVKFSPDKAYEEQDMMTFIQEQVVAGKTKYEISEELVDGKAKSPQPMQNWFKGIKEKLKKAAKAVKKLPSKMVVVKKPNPRFINISDAYPYPDCNKNFKSQKSLKPGKKF